MNAAPLELVATALFALALTHTFLTSYFKNWARRYPEGSVLENLFHLLGEVEVTFGLWAGVLVVTMAAWFGQGRAVEYMDTLNFSEPLFVFAIMAMTATRPVVTLANKLIERFSVIFPVKGAAKVYLASLILGPILGSLITEPAAITVTALILKDRFFGQRTSYRFKYVTLAILLVNVSIGGVLTSFAAPPVLMVAGRWGWDSLFMVENFGWKAVIAVVINAFLAYFLLRKELKGMQSHSQKPKTRVTPFWIIALNMILIALVVMNAHHPSIFLGIFLFFLGIHTITREYNDELKFRESLLVAFFLAGLVVLGGLQRWWLQPALGALDDQALFVGATFLTAITDNAALTYLGSQVEGITDSFKYFLVAGAVAGGGLTVVANAPNPAAFAILQDTFGKGGVNPLKLFIVAFVPTLVAMSCFWLL